MISNREIKTLMSLSTKKGRKESGKYLIEGFRITRSALRNKAPVLKIYITDKFKSSNDFQQIFSLIPKKVNVANSTEEGYPQVLEEGSMSIMVGHEDCSK